MFRVLALACALALSCACVSSPAGAVTLYNSRGGIIAVFIAKYRILAKLHLRVRIEGECASACTTILGIVPRSRICVGPSAWFGFHSASEFLDGPYSRSGTLLMRKYFASDVLAVIQRHGWDAVSPHPDLIQVYGEELRSILRPCT